MRDQKFFGFIAQDGSGEVIRKISAAIQAVINEQEATEDKIRKAVRQMGYKITSLNFSPRTGVNGEIRGGKMAQFRFTAIFESHEIKGGTWIR